MLALRLAAVLSVVLCAQSPVITVSAFVVDELGAPLADVVIDGLYFSRNQFAKTGEDGRAENRTSFPRLAFRKPGYQTVIAAPEPQMKVVMKTPQMTSIPRCTAPHQENGNRSSGSRCNHPRAPTATPTTTGPSSP